MGKNYALKGIILSIVLAMCLLPGTAIAAKNGSVLIKTYHSNSKIFAMGDSTGYQLFAGSLENPQYDGYGHKGAAICKWGGHYKAQGNYGYVIDTEKSKKKLKEAVQKELGKSGKAYVFLLATDNTELTSSISWKGHVATAKYVKKWTAKYNNKTVAPSVYCLSLVAGPGEAARARKYNRNLRALCKKTAGITYIKLPEDAYLDGDYHFSEEGAWDVWNIMHKKAGHHMGAWKVSEKATLSKNGKGYRTCSVCGGNKETKTIYRPYTFTLQGAPFYYTGKEIKPPVKVKNSVGNIIKSSFYTVKYYNNVEVGTASAKITFKGKYSGKKTLRFKIKQREQEANL